MTASPAAATTTRRRPLQHHLHPGQRPRHRDRWHGRHPPPRLSNQSVTWDELLASLDANFQGHTDLHRLLLEDTPKYGNDERIVDAWCREDFRCVLVDDRRPAQRAWRDPSRGHAAHDVPCVFRQGDRGVAGRGSWPGETVSEGISPVQRDLPRSPQPSSTRQPSSTTSRPAARFSTRNSRRN